MLVLSLLHTPTVEDLLDPMPSLRWGRPRRTDFQPRAVGKRLSMNTDMPLCVVGSTVPRGLDVYFGASQCAMVCTGVWLRAATPVRFVPVRPNFSSHSVVFGIRLAALSLMVLLLVACGRSGTSAPDVLDVSRADDASAWADSVSDIGDESAVLDAATDVAAARDGSDVADARDAPAPPPPIQWRRTCATMPEGDPSIPAPRLIYPMSPMRVTSQRPRFRWELPSGVTGARVDLCRDPCCERPIASFDAEGDSGQPAEPLPPGVVFWRARGRVGTRVGREVSFTWEISVRHRSAPVDTAWGTLKDFNGDGFDDVIALVMYRVTARPSNAVRIYWGGPNGMTRDNYQEFEDDGRLVSAQAGDFNGDGMADVIVCSWRLDGFGARPYFLRGTTTGIARSPRTAPIGGACDIGSVADFNGDGFSDIAGLVSDGTLPPYSDGYFEVTFGGPDGLVLGRTIRASDPSPREERTLFAHALASPGDVNGDGYADIAASTRDSWGRYPRRFHIYDGGRFGPASAPSMTVYEDPGTEFGGFADQIRSIGDVNGDRLGDLGVARANARVFDVFIGSAQDHIVRNFRQEIRAEPEAGERPVISIATDLDGDGIGELVYGCSRCLIDPLSSLYGYVDIWVNPASEMRALAYSINNRIAERYDYASGLTCPGDIDGDGLDDLVVGNVDLTPFAGLINELQVFYGGGSAVVGRSEVVGSGTPVPPSSLAIIGWFIL